MNATLCGKKETVVFHEDLLLELKVMMEDSLKARAERHAHPATYSPCSK